jgi:3-phenylpropionate/trans-cinnamate dioxygenase ferredoxin reductase subunit
LCIHAAALATRSQDDNAGESTVSVVIVGAGQAGACTAAALRELGYSGPVVLVGEERHLPYERPPLSKEVLHGHPSKEAQSMFEAAFYEERRITLRLGSRVETVDRPLRQVIIASGERLDYEHLVLATGLRSRHLRGFDLSERLFHLRTRDDALRLKHVLESGLRVLVVGGGLLGLELAATTRQIGCDVTVIERQPAVLYQSVAPVVGSHVAKLHDSNGVRIRTGVTVLDLCVREDRVCAELSSGEALIADIVIAATGSNVNTELAEACGLEVQDGIIVDEYGRTSDRHIFAVGDVARHYNAALGRTIRVESWHNAKNQSVAAARAIAGRPQPYAEVPWFWSDQFDMNLQIVGYSSDWDRVVVRGDSNGRRFTVFYLQGDRVVAANTVNNGRDVRMAKDLVAHATPVREDLLADERVPLANAGVSASVSAG